MKESGFANKFRFELHGTKTFNFAIDVVVAIDQTNVFHFGAHFDHTGRAFELEVFDQGHGVAVLQDIAGGIFENLAGFNFRLNMLRPFVRTFWTDEIFAIFISEF